MQRPEHFRTSIRDNAHIARRWLFLALLAFARPLAASDFDIQDNSFLIEEAYNQEPRVVQHILNYTHTRDGGWSGSFTQEWPAGGLKNQLSYTIVGSRTFDDVLLNYRYQLVGDGEAQLAVAPRVSALLKTKGLQVQVPASYVVNDRIVTHWNAGATVAQHLKPNFDLGGSVIFVAEKRVHLMLEALWTLDEFIVSPGVRWAYDRPHNLQIVPGIAFPIGHDTRAVFVYLSFEHPF